ncbi:hypothetical protein BJ742DRAFT_822594 [Cladochytrium replicatum]|nr:hypothetical protein BJ742DRAFT_822594 [Cladochytrium replicatum]
MHKLKTRRPIRRKNNDDDDDKSDTRPSAGEQEETSPRMAQRSPPSKTREALRAKLAARNASPEELEAMKQEKSKKTKKSSAKKEGGYDFDSLKRDAMDFFDTTVETFSSWPIIIALLVLVVVVLPLYYLDTGLIVANTANVFRPEKFHSGITKGPYFEGWYFKFVDPETKDVLAVIPGIYNPRNTENQTALVYTRAAKLKASSKSKFDSKDWNNPSEWPADLQAELAEARLADQPTGKEHAFVMVFRSNPPTPEEGVLYFQYDRDQFEALPDTKEDAAGKFGFRARIGKSVFSHEGIFLDLNAKNLVYTDPKDFDEFYAKSLTERTERLGKDILLNGDGRFLSVNKKPKSLSVSGEIAFENMVPFPRSWSAPGVMGWFSYFPFLECYHGLVSQHHSADGKIVFMDGSKVAGHFDARDADGYIEKDWGNNFPLSWVWIASNTFSQNKKSSLMVSMGDVPLLAPSNSLYPVVTSLPVVGPWLKRNLRFIGFLITVYDGKTTHLLGYPQGCKLTELTTRLDESIETARETVILEIVCSAQSKKLSVMAERVVGSGIPLLGPRADRNRMFPIIEESLNAVVTVKLEDTKSGSILFSDKSFGGGLETGGNLFKKFAA